MAPGRRAPAFRLEQCRADCILPERIAFPVDPVSPEQFPRADCARGDVAVPLRLARPAGPAAAARGVGG